MPFFLTEHFWAFFFGEPGKHFYEGNVYGNVVAVLPLAVLGVAGYLWHRGVLREAHEKLDRLAAAHVEHAEKLDRLLNTLDPETDGGLADIKEMLDPDTPSGLGVVNEKLDRLIEPKRSGKMGGIE